MSHLNAREEPDVAFMGKGSKFLATKYQGELAVQSEFPDATIFRPSDAYGQGDEFVNYWLSRFRQQKGRTLSLYGKGELTVKQPIFWSDLLTGIIKSIHDPSAIGETYEAVGPERMTQAELLTYMYGLTTRTKEFGTFDIKELMFDPKAFARAWLMSKMPVGQVYTFKSCSLDRLERESISDTSEGYPDMAESLGVELHTLADKLRWEVEGFDIYSYYHYETVEEKPVATPYKTLSLAEERRLLEKRNMGMLALLPGVAV